MAMPFPGDKAERVTVHVSLGQVVAGKGGARTQTAASSGWAVLKVSVWTSKEDRVCLMKMRQAVNRLSPGVTRREAVVTGVRIPTDRQMQRHCKSS